MLPFFGAILWDSLEAVAIPKKKDSSQVAHLPCLDGLDFYYNQDYQEIVEFFLWFFFIIVSDPNDSWNFSTTVQLTFGITIMNIGSFVQLLFAVLLQLHLYAVKVRIIFKSEGHQMRLN